MPEPLTRRQAIVLAAVSADSAASFAPVQVQKLFFLIDENVSSHLGGRQFAFRPYDYGPFDAQVYRELEALAVAGLIHITPGAGGQRRYSLTPTGFAEGERVRNGLPASVSAYLAEASRWVRSLSFAALVGSIYRAYPHMRENSIFIEQ